MPAFVPAYPTVGCDAGSKAGMAAWKAALPGYAVTGGTSVFKNS